MSSHKITVKWPFRVLAVVIFAALTFGAIALPWALHSWLVVETGNLVIANSIALVVFLGFAISLGVASGVYSFLYEYRQTPLTRIERKGGYAIYSERAVPLDLPKPIKNRILRH